MVSKYPYLLLKFRLVTIWFAIGYICDKFRDFQRSFKGTSKSFYNKVFCIELRCKWVNTKNLEFLMECCYIAVLLWKRVLIIWGYILKTAIARHSNIIPFDSQ